VIYNSANIKGNTDLDAAYDAFFSAVDVDERRKASRVGWRRPGQAARGSFFKKTKKRPSWPESSSAAPGGLEHAAESCYAHP
jgi:hypothetical protein